MMPDVVMDVGNSRIKWGRVEAGRVTEMVALAHDSPVDWKRQWEIWGLRGDSRCAIAGVRPPALHRLLDWLPTSRTFLIDNALLMESANVLPMRVAVDNPDRIGIDRVLTALAATLQTPSVPRAIINVGTAMTVDFVDDTDRHVGGAILPGPQLMLDSLTQRTALLPPRPFHQELPRRIFGTETDSAMQLGVASAILGAADQLIWDWAEDQIAPLHLWLTGGAAAIFQEFVFTADLGPITQEPRLTLQGILAAAERLAS
ncbi:MAG: type III pantothenate kinase [Gemmataceae bacterium]